MDYLHNFLKFVVQRCAVNMKDAQELIKKCEQDYQTKDEYLPVIVYGNLLKINDEHKQSIRLLVKEVYGDRCTILLKEIYEFAYTKEIN